MNLWLAAQLAQGATWLAAEDGQFDADQVTPGFGGFAVVALLGVALFLLGLDLVRRLRRSKYRSEIRESLADELAERDAAAAGGAGSAVSGGEVDPGAGHDSDDTAR